MSELTDRLLHELQDREYREGYDEALLDHVIASQIKVIREQRDLTQTGLAKAAGMKQSRISEIEDEDYGSWSINTLRRVAHALGVRLRVYMEEWSTILEDVERSDRNDLERRRFEDDPVFRLGPKALKNADEIVKATISMAQTTQAIAFPLVGVREAKRMRMRKSPKTPMLFPAKPTLTEGGVTSNV